MPQIDIKLTSAADDSGFRKIQASGEELGRKINGLGTQWDTFTKNISKKFTGSDIAKQFVGGLGIGSGMAIAEKAAGMIAEYWKSAAESAERVAAMTDRQLKAVEASLKLRRTDEQELAILQEKQARLTANANAITPNKTRGGQEMPLTSKRAEERRLLVTEAEELNPEIIRLQQKIAADKEAAAKKAADVSASAAQAQVDDSEKIEESVAKLNEKLTAAAQKYRELADPALKYREELAAIDNLSRITRSDGTAVLSESDAAAAKARILAEMNDTAGKAIKSARDAVEDFDKALAKIDANPALTDNEKHAARMKVLDAQEAAIKRLKKELEDFATANPGLATAAIGGEISALGSKGADIEAKRIAPASKLEKQRTDYRASQQEGYQTAGEGAAGGVIGFLAQAGTMADQLAAGIQNTLGSAVSGITQGIMGWVNGTMTFKQALANIGQTILQTMLQTIIQMGVQWVVTTALAKLGIIGVHTVSETAKAAGTASTITQEAAKTPILMTNAAAASAGSFGLSAVIGIALLAALLGAFAAGFEDGGFTSKGPSNRPAGIVHAGEWVAPQWMVDSPTVGPLIASLEGMRNGSPGFDMGGFVSPMLAVSRPAFEPAGGGASGFSGGGSPAEMLRPMMIVLNDPRDAARMLQENSHAWFYDMHQKAMRKNT